MDFVSNIPKQEEFTANFNEMWCRTTPHELFDHSIENKSLKMINWNGLLLNLSTTLYNDHVARNAVKRNRKMEIAMKNEGRIKYVGRRFLEMLMIVLNRPIDEWHDWSMFGPLIGYLR